MYTKYQVVLHSLKRKTALKKTDFFLSHSVNAKENASMSVSKPTVYRLQEKSFMDLLSILIQSFSGKAECCSSEEQFESSCINIALSKDIGMQNRFLSQCILNAPHKWILNHFEQSLDQVLCSGSKPMHDRCRQVEITLFSSQSICLVLLNLGTLSVLVFHRIYLLEASYSFPPRPFSSLLIII